LAIKLKDRPTGPALAILTIQDEQRLFRGNRDNFIDLIKIGGDMGVFVYVTTVQDFKPGERRITGYVYDEENNTWIPLLLPPPPVLYNRIPSREDELLPEVQQQIRTILKHPSIRLFNPFFFDKWTLFEWLGKAQATRRYIPATRKLTSPRRLESFLSRYSVVYLKPVQGKAGKGIMRAEFHNENASSAYRLSVQSGKKSQVSHHGDLSALWTSLKQYIDSEDYIIQQGVPLALYRKRPFDLRVLVQKNRSGTWSLTGVGARVAGKKSITTHVPRGGSIDEPDKLLASSFGKVQGVRIMKHVRHAVLTLAKRIEKASGHPLGEMSMDLGIDHSGQIWFFEANSRPMKFDEPEIRQKSLENIIRYSRYLAKSIKKK
jgi:hypothetical protein